MDQLHKNYMTLAVLSRVKLLIILKDHIKKITVFKLNCE